jgi:AP-3 complex subunit beta
VEVDEWGQVDLINLLLRYARTMLPRPTKGNKGAAGGDGEEEEIDSDVKLLLESVEGIFQSRNPAVRVFFVLFVHFVLLMKVCRW